MTSCGETPPPSPAPLGMPNQSRVVRGGGELTPVWSGAGALLGGHVTDVKGLLRCSVQSGKGSPATGRHWCQICRQLFRLMFTELKLKQSSKSERLRYSRYGMCSHTDAALHGATSNRERLLVSLSPVSCDPWRCPCASGRAPRSRTRRCSGPRG